MDVADEADRGAPRHHLDTRTHRVAVRAASSIRATIVRIGVGVGTAQRRCFGLLPATDAFAGSSATPPTSAVNDQTSIRARRGKSLRPRRRPRPGGASRAPSALEDLRTSLLPYLSAAGKIGVHRAHARHGRRRALVALVGERMQRRRLLVGECRDLHQPASRFSHRGYG